MILAMGLLAAVFLPSPVGGCLGPIGVTGIQCAKATGIYPSVGPGMPILGASLLFAAVVGIPESPIGWRRLLVAGAGAGIGIAVYIWLRPTTWSGPTSTGEVITVALPFDLSALVVAGLVGASAALVLDWAWRRVRPASRGGAESRP